MRLQFGDLVGLLLELQADSAVGRAGDGGAVGVLLAADLAEGGLLGAELAEAGPFYVAASELVLVVEAHYGN